MAVELLMLQLLCRVSRMACASKLAGRCLHGRSEAASAIPLAGYWTFMPRLQSNLISLHLTAADLTACACDCGALDQSKWVCARDWICMCLLLRPIHEQSVRKIPSWEQESPLSSALSSRDCPPSRAATTTIMPAPKFKVALIQMCPKVRSSPQAHRPSHISPSNAAEPSLTTYL